MAKKLGLVLEGGGGKGAYQLGVLKAFAERNLRFDCVAGTSVGGLNAALWAADKLAEGENLWFNISQDKIYPWRRPRWFGCLLMWLLVPLNLTVNYVRGSMLLPTTRRTELFVRVALGITSVITLLAGFYGCRTLFPLGFSLAAFLLVASIAYNRTGFIGSMILSYVGIFIALAAVLAMLMMFNIYLVIGGRDTVLFLLIFGIIGLPVVAAILTTFVLVILEGLGKRLLSQSFLNSLPLRREVELIMQDVTFRIPVYVVAAEPRKLVDPDDMYSIPSGFDIAKKVASLDFPKNVSLTAFTPKRFIPTYLALSEFRGEELVDALMATAALPIGIVRSVEIRGLEFVDGGIADNRPLFPLIALEKCDEITVVCLRTLSKEEQEGEQRRWQELYRLIDLSRLDQEHLARASKILASSRLGVVMNDPPTDVPYRSVPLWPKVRYITPKSSLGVAVRAGERSVLG